MKKRTIKKQAHAFYKGRLSFPTYEDTGYGFAGCTVKVLALLHPSVEKEVKKIAREKYGWDGNHWDNPLVVGHYEI